MNNKKVQSILENALEQRIPSSEIQLWTHIQADLVTREHLVEQGEKMNTTMSLTKRAVFTTLVVAAFLAFFLMAPQGRAFAQSILQFFTRTESDTFYQEPSDLTFEDTTPFHEECGISIGPRCSVEQIRSMVDFEVKELGTIPEGIHFVGSTGGPDYVELKYEYENRRDGTLSIIVEAVGHPSAIGTGIAAKSAPIEQVLIGDLPGEYYTGILFQDDQGNVTWQPNDPTATLRWEDGDSTYTMVYYSPKYRLGKEELIRLGESMTTESVAK